MAAWIKKKDRGTMRSLYNVETLAKVSIEGNEGKDKLRGTSSCKMDP